MFNTNSTPIRAGTKVIGHVEGDKFIKRVRGSKHMLRQPRGWALDILSLGDAERMGARTVEIEDTESGLTYSTSIALVWSKGLRLNRGFGDQIALPLHLFTMSEAGTHQLALL